MLLQMAMLIIALTAFGLLGLALAARVIIYVKSLTTIK